MGHVTVTLNAKTYRLRCGDGEEQRLAELAEHVGQRIELLAAQFGQFGDERLLLMAALLITDDMLEMKARLERIDASGAAAAGDATEFAFPVEADAGQPVEPVVDSSPGPVESAVMSSPAPHHGADDRYDAPPVPAPRALSPRRGSLEARLAQARVGQPSKTGTRSPPGVANGPFES